MLRDDRSTAAPTVHTNHSCTLIGADGSKLAFKEPSEPIIVGGDHHLPPATDPTEKIRETEEVHVVTALQRIIERCELER